MTAFPTAALTRRGFALGLSAAALTGCVSGTGAERPARAPRPAIQVAKSPEFDAWLSSFRARAAARGLSDATLSAAFRDAGYLPGVIERDRSQFQTRRSLEDYVAIATSDARVAKGREMLRAHRGTLQAIEARYGLPPEVITAIWGVESRYGERRGDYPLFSALATLGFASRRRGFFEGQLIAALRILQRGDAPASKMTGSWAGAMGHTQFIPTTYLSYAVDFDGDGRRDVWGADPGDALASAGNYLARSGWQRGQPWGLEVPPGKSRPGMVRPQVGGPAFVRTANFRALLRYNSSDKYVIAVGHLSDRLRGRGGFRQPFPPDANGLTLADRKRLQARLKAKGFEIGTVDGVIGDKTRSAIRAYQAKAGLAVTGAPSPALLAAL